MDTTAIEKSCRQCSTSFVVTAEDLAFYEKVSPVFNGKKELIPPPTLCPSCRERRRMAFRNERKLYRRKCDLTKKDIISIYPAESVYSVYDSVIWWGDDWEGLDYGKEYNFSQPFFEQFAKLIQDVPVLSAVNNNGREDINSEYTNEAGNNKNCYLIFNAGYNEECYYSYGINGCRNCMDCMRMVDCSLCYQCVDGIRSYSCSLSQNIQECTNCMFCHACQFCQDCYGCVNLNNGRYAIYNTYYTKEEYEARVGKLRTLPIAKQKQQLEEHLVKFPRKYMEAYQSENVTGNYVHFSKNSTHCYDCLYLEDCKWCGTLMFEDTNTDCYDISTWGQGMQMCYEGLSVGGNVANLLFCAFGWFNSTHLLYCNTCSSCHDCFGCASLKHKQYCILNKQYTKEEYEELVPKIIEHMRQNGEWWEFFPGYLSRQRYQDTMAMDFYPLEHQEALKLWFNWNDCEVHFPKVEKTIPAEKLPEDITKIPDDILNWAIICEVSGKPFRIIKQELEFYRKHNLPIPKRHPDQRHLNRMALRNPRKLWERNCDCIDCEKNHKSGGVNVEPLVEWQNAVRIPDGSLRQTFQTTYAPERPEKVYCEVCYNREVYG